MMYGNWMGSPWGFGFSLISFLMMAVFLVLALIGLVLLVRWLLTLTRSAEGQPRPSETALEILKKRYARGEIDKQEFEAKLKDLRD